MEQGFKSLLVWQKAIELADGINRAAKQLPREEEYGLASQIKRAAISIPSNIAEGSRRGTRRDYLQFIRIANGSLAELETQLILLKRWYPRTKTEHLEEQAREVGRMLSGLARRLATPSS